MLFSVPEQFTVHRKLLEKEQALYESVIDNWRTIGSSSSISCFHSDCSGDDLSEHDVSVPRKRPSASSSRKVRKKRQKKRLRSSVSFFLNMLSLFECFTLNFSD